MYQESKIDDSMFDTAATNGKSLQDDDLFLQLKMVISASQDSLEQHLFHQQESLEEIKKLLTDDISLWRRNMQGYSTMSPLLRIGSNPNSADARDFPHRCASPDIAQPAPTNLDCYDVACNNLQKPDLEQVNMTADSKSSLRLSDRAPMRSSKRSEHCLVGSVSGPTLTQTGVQRMSRGSDCSTGAQRMSRGSDSSVATRGSEGSAGNDPTSRFNQKTSEDIRKERSELVGGTSVFTTHVRESSRARSVHSVHRIVSARKAKNPIQKIVSSQAFDLLCGLCILANAVLVGVETQCNTRQLECSKNIIIAQNALNFGFCGELLLRVYNDGCRRWWTSSEWRWNWFDTILVIVFLADYLAQNLNAKAFNLLRVLRAVRLLRVVRTLRLVRMFRYVREFRKMVFALTNSIHTLMWAIMILVFELLFFAICFTQAANEFRQHNGIAFDSAADPHLIFEHYGSIPRSFYTMFMAMTGGINWGLVFSPLLHCRPHWLFSGLFLMFISITVLGVMNIIAAVFVESAMQATAHERELMIQEKNQMKEAYIKHIEEIFHQIDADESGEISLGEVEYMFANQETKDFLEVLEIDANDGVTLFRLLDRDNSGLINIEEFCEGCLRLKGEARSFDIYCLLYETQRHITKTTVAMTRWEELYSQQKKLSDHLIQLQDNIKGLRGSLDMRPMEMQTVNSASAVEKHADSLDDSLRNQRLDLVADPPFCMTDVPDVSLLYRERSLGVNDLGPPLTSTATLLL